MKRLLSFVLVIVMVVLVLPAGAFTLTAQAATFAGGDGTAANPYQIKTVAQLNAIREDLDASYKLVADITFKDSDFEYGGTCYNDGAGWEPIGGIENDKRFSGTFDGNGHTIKNLYVKTTRNYVGLFACAYNATIKNVNLTSVDMDVVGLVVSPLVAVSYGSTILNCSTSGTVTVTAASSSVGGSFVGGMVAFGYSTDISECTNSCDIIASDSVCVGGIAGSNTGVINQCANNGILTVKQGAGIVGVSTDLEITRCYNTGTIIAVTAGAGIAVSGSLGDLEKNGTAVTVSKCYNVGLISAGNYAGGILALSTGATVKNVYNAGRIVALSNEGSVAGIACAVSKGTYQHCYNVGLLSGSTKGDAIEGILYINDANASSISDTYVFNDYGYKKMTTKSTYKGFDFDDVWTMGGNSAYPFPELQGVDMKFTKAIAGIAMAKKPKTSYKENEKLDVTGGKVSVIYNDRTTKNIDLKSSMVSGFDSSKTGKITLGVAYSGFITSYDVEIKHVHSFGAWKNYSDTQHKRVCKADSSHVEYADHNWDKGTVTKAATCVKTGVKTYTCADCGATKTETIKKTAHNYVDDKCTVCGNISDAKLEKSVFKKGNIVRTYGDTRYETSIQTANTLKKVLGVSKFDTIIVAYGRNYADALAGSYLAALKDAPILVVNTDKTNANDKASMTLVRNYINNNLSSKGTVYVLGGEAVISKDFEKSLKKSGRTVKRLAGSTRYETNIKILEEAGFTGNDLLIADAYNYADALSASSLGKPILLVDKSTGKLNSTQKAYLTKVKSNIKNVYLIGGTAAVPKSIQSNVESIVSSAKIARIAGANRYETSVKIAEKFYKSPNTMVLAYGHNFPDGLCGGPLAYALGAPLVLSHPDYDNLIYAINYSYDNKSIEYMMVLGGEGTSENPQLTDTLIGFIMDGDIVKNKY